jgi:hypothetical protein
VENITAILDEHQKLVSYHMRDLFDFLEKKDITNISREYKANIGKRKVDIGFNLFTIISDTYHQENFHSDILKSILDPSENHRKGDQYLTLFLEFIKSHNVEISLSNYNNALVLREKGKIDILIEDAISKRAIIIENKINNAPDMDRQLPRYLKFIKDRGLICDAIIYLRLNQNSLPNTKNWTAAEKEEIWKLLLPVSAYNETEYDILNGWIYKAEKITNQIDVLLILRQYGSLIKKLGANIMNKQIMNKFYDQMMVSDNYQTALSLNSMLNDLILYRVNKLIEEFRVNCNPFDSVNNWKDFVVYFFKLPFQQADLSIDIGVYQEHYSFQFWDRNHKSQGVGPIVSMLLTKLNMEREFHEEGNRMCKEFKFPTQENELYDFIRKFNERLEKAINSIGK